MRYQLEQEIDAPRELVFALMQDHQNLTKWQPDLLSVEHLSGVSGQVGAKTLQVNRQGKGQLEIIETITESRPPETLCAMYEGGSVRTLVECQFSDLGENRTKWVLISDFQSTNILMKLMAVFAPGMFKKQTTKFMNQFKDFVEATS
ncbi:MAG: SRPBCC family protein [Pseudomonadales bacterium]